MTEHSSPAGGNGESRPAARAGQFGPPEQGDRQQPAPYGYPPQAPGATPPSPAGVPSEAVRAQVAAAWTRSAAQAAVPTLPPRERQPETAQPSKKDRREQARAQRKAAYEQKKAERESRKRGGAPAPVLASAPAPAPGAAATDAAPTGRSGGFDVPRPGGRLPTGGRRTHIALRATLLITTCAFALGSCGVMGLVVGKSSTAPTAALDAKDVRRYRLTDYPTRAAATFAERYATLCLTYDPKATDERRAEMARYTTAGVDRDCGWNGRGEQSVRSAVWDGSVEDLPEYGRNGRYLGVQVTLADGRVTSLSVPVYVTDLAAGSGLRIVGDVGEMPLPLRGSAPEVDREGEVVDGVLSEQLKAQVLPGYFTAWGASDATAMSRFTSTDAAPAATAGLSGALSSPQVQSVEALAPAGTEDSDTVTYKDGQVVPVRVTVVWGGDPAAVPGRETAPSVRRAYRLKVVNTAQGWFIKDVRGALIDPAGGTGDGDGTGAAPSAAPSTPASGATPTAPARTTPPPAKGKPAPPPAGRKTGGPSPRP